MTFPPFYSYLKLFYIYISLGATSTYKVPDLSLYPLNRTHCVSEDDVTVEIEHLVTRDALDRP